MPKTEVLPQHFDLPHYVEMLEAGFEPVWFSRELIEHMSNYGPPVKIKAYRMSNGELSLMFLRDIELEKFDEQRRSKS